MLTNVANTAFILLGWLSFGYTWRCRKVDRVEKVNRQVGGRPVLERQSTDMQMLAVNEGGKSFDRAFSMESTDGKVIASNGNVTNVTETGTRSDDDSGVASVTVTVGDESRSSTETTPVNEMH